VGAESPGILAARPLPESLATEFVGLDDPRWDPYVGSRPEATFFHRSEWQRIMARTYGYAWHGLLAVRGARVVGALPLFRVPAFLMGTALMSVPFAAYGGAVADDAAAGQALLATAEELGDRLGARYVEIRDGMLFPAMQSKELYVTFRRAIGPDHDENFAAIRGKQRTSIRSAQKRGLTYHVGGRELLPVFYPIYSHSVRNLGTPVFPKRLFHAIFEEAKDATNILVVESGGKAVSAVLSFFDKDHVLPYYAGTLREAYRYSASDYMYWSLMCAAADRGCRVFDFGRSKLNTGSYDFKKHWGFEPTPLRYQYRLIRARRMPDVTPKNPKFGAAIGVWRVLPLAVAERIGPAIVRWFP